MRLSKTDWGIAVSVFFAIATWITPVPVAWRRITSVAALVALGISIFGWLCAHSSFLRQLRASAKATHPMAMLVVFIFSGLFGALVWYFAPAGRVIDETDEPATAGSPPTVVAPGDAQCRASLQAILIVDFLRQKDARFHVDIMNNGEITAEEVGVGLQTPEAALFDLVPRGTRTLEPGDRRQLPEVLFSEFAESRTLSVITSFSYRCGDRERSELSQHFYFSVPDAEVVGAEFYPISVSREAGNVLVKKRQDEVSRHFSRATGAMGFVLEENREDGTPNHVTMKNDVRSFVFDPVAGHVWFSTSDGAFSLDMAFPHNDAHSIQFAWDEKGPTSLAIGGRLKHRDGQPEVAGSPGQSIQVSASPNTSVHQAGGDINLVQDPHAIHNIRIVTVEARLTCTLKPEAEVPPAEVEFVPIGDAHAYFEGPTGRARLTFVSPVQFRLLGTDRVTTVNQFSLDPASGIQNRPIDALMTFEELSMPVVTVVYGNAFDKITLLELTVFVNGDAIWYGSWKYDTPFQQGPRFRIPLDGLWNRRLGEIAR